MAVDKEDEAVVGADADDVAGGDRGQIEGPAEVENQGLAQGRGGMGDPGGLPIAMGWIWLDSGFGVQRERRDKDGEKGQELAHSVCLPGSSSQG